MKPEVGMILVLPDGIEYRIVSVLSECTCPILSRWQGGDESPSQPHYHFHGKATGNMHIEAGSDGYFNHRIVEGDQIVWLQDAQHRLQLKADCPIQTSIF